MVKSWMIDGWGGGGRFQGKRKAKSYGLEQL